MIPQCNPYANYLNQKVEIDHAISEVLTSGRYILNKQVENFESEFAEFCSAKASVGVGNGTDAITLALMALGVGAGDQVLTVSHTATATVSAIINAGARPLMIDINVQDYNMDITHLEAALDKNPSVKAIVLVHLYGQLGPVKEVQGLCKDRNLFLIEDCSQAHGAELEGKKAGTFGDMGTFSFYPTKNLGALGDGGAVIGSDKTRLEKVKMLREYGWQERYVSSYNGLNSRLDEIQAAILRIKLRQLTESNEARRAIAKTYDEGVINRKITKPELVRGTHVFHQYVIRTESGNDFRKYMQEAGIGVGWHYPAPVHLQPAFKNPQFIYKKLSNTEKIQFEIASLPMFPELKMEDVGQIVEAINKY